MALLHDTAFLAGLPDTVDVVIMGKSDDGGVIVPVPTVVASGLQARFMLLSAAETQTEIGITSQKAWKVTLEATNDLADAEVDASLFRLVKGGVSYLITRCQRARNEKGDVHHVSATVELE